MKNALNVIANILFFGGAFFILACLFSVAYEKGIWAVLKILSPFNIVNYFLMFLALLPGILVKMLSEKVK